MRAVATTMAHRRKEYSSVRLKSRALLPLLFALASLAWAQDADKTNPPDSERVFGVVRTFGITNDKNAEPLTPRGKFRIFRQNVTDPFTFVGTAIQAGIGQATNDFPSYGQGAAGYAKRYGAAVADFATGEFMSTLFFRHCCVRIPGTSGRAREVSKGGWGIRSQAHS